MNLACRSIALGVAVVLGSGCSVLGLDDGTESELKDQRRAWLAQDYENYSYVYTRSCFCPEVRPVRITVENDEVTKVVVVETGEPVTQFTDFYMTITDLYAYLIDAADRADEMDVEYDDVHHIPRHVSIDFIENAIDDELGLTLSNLLVFIDVP